MKTYCPVQCDPILTINNLNNHDYGFYLIIVAAANQNLQRGHGKTGAASIDATHRKTAYWHGFIWKRHVCLSYIRIRSIQLTKHQLSIGQKKKQIKITEGIKDSCTKK